MQAVIFSPPKTEDGVPGLWCWPGFIGDVKDVDSCTHNPSLSLSLSLGARVSLANRSSFLITSSSTLSIFFFYFPCSSRINPDVNPPSPGRALFIPVDCGLSKRRHLLSNASLQRALHLDDVNATSGGGSSLPHIQSFPSARDSRRHSLSFRHVPAHPSMGHLFLSSSYSRCIKSKIKDICRPNSIFVWSSPAAAASCWLLPVGGFLYVQGKR
jgi:hypothetical protein